MGAYFSSDTTITTNENVNTGIEVSEIVEVCEEKVEVCEVKVEEQEKVENSEDQEKIEKQQEKLVETGYSCLITIDDENVGIFDGHKKALKYVMEYANVFVERPQYYLIKLINGNKSLTTFKIMEYSNNYIFNYDTTINIICIHQIPTLNYM